MTLKDWKKETTMYRGDYSQPKYSWKNKRTGEIIRVEKDLIRRLNTNPEILTTTHLPAKTYKIPKKSMFNNKDVWIVEYKKSSDDFFGTTIAKALPKIKALKFAKLYMARH